MADLYCQHFSDEQLQALLDFCSSEMGKSILDVEQEIASHFQQRMHDLVPELNESKGFNSLLGSSSNPFAPR
jgi:hypothetical protein